MISLETRTKLKAWSEAIDKLDEETMEKEALVWIVTALDILEPDMRREGYIKEGRK